jgi:hypothetical protein
MEWYSIPIMCFLPRAPSDLLCWICSSDLDRISSPDPRTCDPCMLIMIRRCQAAGVIPVSHASRGPLKDIVVPFNGVKIFIPDHNTNIWTPIKVTMQLLQNHLSRLSIQFSHCLHQVRLLWGSVLGHGLSKGFRTRNLRKYGMQAVGRICSDGFRHPSAYMSSK